MQVELTEFSAVYQIILICIGGVRYHRRGCSVYEGGGVGLISLVFVWLSLKLGGDEGGIVKHHAGWNQTKTGVIPDGWGRSKLPQIAPC